MSAQTTESIAAPPAVSVTPGGEAPAARLARRLTALQDQRARLVAKIARNPDHPGRPVWAARIAELDAAIVVAAARPLQRARAMAVAAARIERKLAADPGSINAAGWRAKLADYAAALETLRPIIEAARPLIEAARAAAPPADAQPDAEPPA